MRCTECGEKYPSKYYFLDEGAEGLVCTTCSKLTSAERELRRDAVMRARPELAPPTVPSVAPRRPRGMWVYLIGTWYLLTGLAGLGSTALLMAGKIQVPPQFQRELAGIGAFDTLLSVCIMACLTTGAVALLLLRRLAFHAFALALVLNIPSLLRNVWLRGYLVSGGVVGLVGYAFGLAVLCAVIAYTRHLERSGRLR